MIASCVLCPIVNVCFVCVGLIVIEAMAPPQLRGMLRRQIMRDIATAFLVGCAGSAAWWFGIARPRQRKFEEFYKNYDANAVAASMTASFEEKGGWALFGVCWL